MKRIESTFLKIVSILYFVGFVLHLLDVFDLRLSFSQMDGVWRLWIIYLMLFDFLVAIFLWKEKLLGQVFFIIVAVSQVIAYTQFVSIFHDQKLLIYFHLTTLFIFAVIKASNYFRARSLT